MTLVTDWLPHHEAAKRLAAHKMNVRKGEGDGLEFFSGELEIAKAAGMAVAKKASTALELFDRMVGLKTGSPVMATTKNVEDKLAQQLEQLDPIMRESWNADTDKLVSGIIGNLTEVGARRAGAFRRFKNLTSRSLIEEGMVASTKYYSNTFFNRVVLPSMAAHIDKQLSTGGAFDDTYFRALRETMETRLKSVPHWRLVGNQAASRAYHYGLGRAGLMDGYTGYTLKAVRDERTSDVCKTLDGKTFWLSDGVQRLEKIARINPSTLKQEAPWLRLEDVAGKETQELVDKEILVPPFHGNCRTTMALNR